MSKTKWEKGPWKAEIEYSCGYPRSARVIAAEPRVVIATTIPMGGLDRYGNPLPPPPGAKVTQSRSVQPAKVADCGIVYAGLSGEQLVGNADLIAAADDLYWALEALLALDCDETRQRALAALAKARGESA